MPKRPNWSAVEELASTLYKQATSLDKLKASFNEQVAWLQDVTLEGPDDARNLPDVEEIMIAFAEDVIQLLEERYGG